MFNELKDQRRGYWAKKRIPFIIKNEINLNITELVFDELQHHVDENGDDGKFRYIYLGAVDSVESISEVIKYLFPKFVNFFDTDDLNIKIHESCAVERSTKVKVFSISFYHPDWNSNELRNRPREIFRISYCSTEIDSLKVVNLLKEIIEKSIISSGFYPRPIEVKLK